MKIFVVIESFFLIVCTMAAFAISLSEFVFDFDQVLKSPKHFFRCVFQYQFCVLALKEYINTAGVVLLEVLVTILSFPANVLLFIVLLICEIFRFSCIGFLKLFERKYND